MIIKKMLLTPNKYSRPQIKLKEIKKIVIHYVGNPNTTAINNRNYFENLKYGHNGVYASSHYIVGLDGEIIQCIPENEIAYASYNANCYSISIENCHSNKDGKFNSKTENSLIELCADICKRYNLNPITDIIRHYDIPKENGYRKKCPLYWVEHEDDFIRFKNKVNEILNNTQKEDNNEMTKYYNSISECPVGFRNTIQKLIDKKYLLGDENGDLKLTYDMMRTFVILDRANLFK